VLNHYGSKPNLINNIAYQNLQSEAVVYNREILDINGGKIQLIYEGSEYLGNMNQPYL
jgi:hypothetical protein